MPTRRTLSRTVSRIGLVVAMVLPTVVSAQYISPDGGTLSANANTTGNVATFTVDNLTDQQQSHLITCTTSGSVTACQSPGSVVVGPWSSEAVDVTYSAGGPGAGAVYLATLSAPSDQGWYNITVVGLARFIPTIDLAPHNGEHRSMALCAAGCFDAVASYTTPAYISMDTPRSLTLFYRSAQAVPWATVQVDATDTSGDFATALSIRLKRPDNSWVQFRDGTSEVFFDRTDFASRLTAQFDATALATGIHSYTLVVRSHWPNEIKEASAPVKVLIGNEWLNSWAPAPGWSIAGLQKWTTDGATGAVLTEGDGSVLHFPKNYCSGGTCYYHTPRGDFTTLTWNSASNYMIRAYPDGSKLRFNSTGDMTYSEDRFGNRTNYFYGTNRRLTQINDPAGKSLTLGYNTSGKLATITDPGGRVTRLEYDVNGNVYRIIRPDNVAAATMSYDYIAGAAGRYRLREQTDAVGGVWTMAYDFAGKLQSQTLPQVAINGVQERPVAGFTSLESSLTSEFITSYSNRAAARIPGNLRARTTNPRGFSTAYQLDRFGAPLRIEEPLGRMTYISRNADAQPLAVAPTLGWWVYYSWDRQNLIATYGGNRPHINYEYEPTYNQVTRVSGDTPPVWNYRFEGKLESTRTGSDTAAPSLFTYDSRGRIKTAGDPRTHGTTYYYATSGWQNTDSVKASSRRTSHAYDAFGRDTAVTNPLNQTSRTAYDALNRVTASIDPLGGTTRYGYNAAYLTSVTDARDQVYGYTPNVLGWVEQETDPRNMSDRYQFDRNGNVTRWTNRRTQDVTMAYDELDQPLTRTADGATTTFRTDPLGRFTATTNSESTDTLWFDGDGRDSTAVTVRGGNAYRLTPTYDRRGPRTQVAMSGPGWSSSIGYRYDAYLGLDTLIDVAGGRTPVTYNADRQPTGWTLPIALSISSGYSSMHAPASVRYPSHPMIDAAIGANYGYDSLSRVRERLNHDRTGGRSFARDALGRLTHDSTFHYQPGTGECTPVYEPPLVYPFEPTGYNCPTTLDKVVDSVRTLAYDLVGNRTDLGAVTETGNRLTSFNGLTLEYDADGNLIRKQRSGVPDQVFAWNSRGQLTSVTSGSGTTTFGYDALGRRVRKSGPLSTTRYLHDGDDLFAELDGDYAVQAEYTYYPGIDRPHSVRRAGAMHYFATDHPGNVVGVVDAGGVLRNDYRYEAFGTRAVVREELGTVSALGYAARELDSETGLYFKRARYYDPALGRFISEDPIGLASGINLFAYASNDPVTYSDPLGLSPCIGNEYQHSDDVMEDGKLILRVIHGCPVETSGYNPYPSDRGASTPRGPISGGAQDFGNFPCRPGNRADASCRAIERTINQLRQLPGACGTIGANARTRFQGGRYRHSRFMTHAYGTYDHSTHTVTIAGKTFTNRLSNLLMIVVAAEEYHAIGYGEPGDSSRPDAHAAGYACRNQFEGT